MSMYLIYLIAPAWELKYKLCYININYINDILYNIILFKFFSVSEFNDLKAAHYDSGENTSDFTKINAVKYDVIFQVKYNFL